MRPFKFFFMMSLGFFLFVFLAKFLILALIVAAVLTAISFVISKIRWGERYFSEHHDESRWLDYEPYSTRDFPYYKEPLIRNEYPGKWTENFKSITVY